MTKLSRFKTFEAKKTKEETPGKVEIKALHAFLLYDYTDEEAGEFCKALAKKKSGQYSPDVELIKPGDVQEYKFKGVSYKVTEVPDENSITHDWRVERKTPKKTKIDESFHGRGSSFNINADDKSKTKADSVIFVKKRIAELKKLISQDTPDKQEYERRLKSDEEYLDRLNKMIKNK